MKSYLEFFKEISKIPRKSGNEEKIANYLVEFANSRGLKYYRDEINNVIIYKDASMGYEDKETIALQSHTDMICEKTPESSHNFLTDSLDLYIDGDFVKARGTSLGADNGVGVSYMLSILDSDEIKTPKLECIFTVQEETTMAGAEFIDGAKISSNKVISFDNFSEDEMWISSATSNEWILKIDSEYIEITDDYTTYDLSFDNFKGGHSGFDIGDKNRINPIKLGIELLKDFNIYINEIKGGSRVNIIPRDFRIVFSTKDDVSDLNKKIEELNKDILFGDIKLKKIEFNKKCFSKESALKIINFVKGYRNGALKKDKYGNVVLSSNMGTINVVGDEILIICSLRTNDLALGQELKLEIDNSINKNAIEVKKYEEFIGYFAKEECELISKCSRIYKEMFNKEINKIKVQACLECGAFDSKISNLEYVSIGPNIYNAHSPDEKFSISSADKMFKYILNILEN